MRVSRELVGAFRAFSRLVVVFSVIAGALVSYGIYQALLDWPSLESATWIVLNLVVLLIFMKVAEEMLVSWLIEEVEES